MPRVAMAGIRFIEPCLPTISHKPPAGDGWLHEIKHDGYRMMVARDESGLRLFTRRGYDWTDRYPAITKAGKAIRAKSFLIDGEAVCCGENDIPEFKLLRLKRRATSVFLFAFDLLQLNGKDLRKEPIEVRKAELVKLLEGTHSGLQISDHIEIDAATMFEHACKLGLEGIVSKRRGSRYESGRSALWLKTKNPDAPAIKRLTEEEWNNSR